LSDSRLTEEQQEQIRKKVALEMLHDPEMKQRVENMVGIERAKIRYPEAYQD
jgi:hypothetical protein